MTALVFLDIETTSLDAETGEIWEVGAIRREGDGAGLEYHWFLEADLVFSDPVSLDIGRFHQRHPWGHDMAPGDVTPLAVFLDEFREVTSESHLVGNVISFDEERLRRLYNRVGEPAPDWHYHLVDVEALVAGKLGIAPPWKSVDLTEAVGVDCPDESERHTALGDARWAMRLYDAVLAG